MFSHRLLLYQERCGAAATDIAPPSKTQEVFARQLILVEESRSKVQNTNNSICVLNLRITTNRVGRLSYSGSSESVSEGLYSESRINESSGPSYSQSVCSEVSSGVEVSSISVSIIDPDQSLICTHAQIVFFGRLTDCGRFYAFRHPEVLRQRGIKLRGSRRSFSILYIRSEQWTSRGARKCVRR